MGELGINLPGLITQLISFSILLFLISKFLYKPVVKLLDERAEKIKKGLDDAELASKSAENAAAHCEYWDPWTPSRHTGPRAHCAGSGRQSLLG